MKIAVEIECDVEFCGKCRFANTMDKRECPFQGKGRILPNKWFDRFWSEDRRLQECIDAEIPTECSTCVYHQSDRTYGKALDCDRRGLEFQKRKMGSDSCGYWKSRTKGNMG